jgi:spermidine synthase
MRLATHPTAAAAQSRSNNSKYGMIALFLVFGLLARHKATRFLTADVRAMSTDSSDIWSKSINEYDAETGFTQSIVVSAQSPIYQKQSAYQSIEVHESHHFGKILVLDGVTQLTERDGDSYNEMMAHMPLFQHPNPKRVLVLGGGDGYIVSEVLKHPSVVHVDHVDLDREVIATCQKFFSWGAVWEDPRVTLHIQDGAAFVEHAPPGAYDVVIQDSSDPWTRNEKGELVPLPSGSLYVPEHYSNIYRALAEDGILNFQVRLPLPDRMLIV